MTPEQQNLGAGEAGPAHLERALAADGTLGRSLALVRYLRDHCEWDARQTTASLRPYLLEEAHEVADAILSGEDSDLARELGDLLLNVAFQIVLAEERGAFDAAVVVRALEDKMMERHPHVYGNAAEPPDWERMKAEQRSRDDQGAAGPPSDDPFDGLPAGMEPLSRALRMQDRAAGLNFDWPDVWGAMEKLDEEVGELEESLRDRHRVTGGGPQPGIGASTLSPDVDGRIEDELGDLLFAAVNVARIAGIHPSTALERASAKFALRFRRVLELATERGLDPHTATLEELDRLWDWVKSENDSPEG